MDKAEHTLTHRKRRHEILNPSAGTTLLLRRPIGVSHRKVVTYLLNACVYLMTRPRPQWRPIQQLCQSTRGYADVSKPITFKRSLGSDHDDLSSFLQYAERVKLNPRSTTYVGTHYEYTVQAALKRLGMSSTRVGGRSDYGIDLLGSWKVPSLQDPVKVLVQCKARASKATPAEIRELEGTFAGAPCGWNGPGVIALLISQREATKGVRDAMGRSRWPMGFGMCSREGKITQMLWNRRAEEEGLVDLAVTLKYTASGTPDEIALLWKGQILPDV